MNLILSGRNMQISHHLEGFIGEKTAKLARHMPTLGEVRVEMAVNKTKADMDRFTCQITTWVDHRMLDAVGNAGDVHRAVNEAIAKLDGQLRKVKVHHQHKGRPSLADNTARQIANEQP